MWLTLLNSVFIYTFHRDFLAKSEEIQKSKKTKEYIRNLRRLQDIKSNKCSLSKRPDVLLFLYSMYCEQFRVWCLITFWSLQFSSYKYQECDQKRVLAYYKMNLNQMKDKSSTSFSYHFESLSGQNKPTENDVVLYNVLKTSKQAYRWGHASENNSTCNCCLLCMER